MVRVWEEWSVGNEAEKVKGMWKGSRRVPPAALGPYNALAWERKWLGWVCLPGSAHHMRDAANLLCMGPSDSHSGLASPKGTLPQQPVTTPTPPPIPNQAPKHSNRPKWSRGSLIRTPLVAQMVKNPPAMQETWAQSLGWEDPLEEGMATHTSILVQRIPTDKGAWWVTVHGVTKSQTWLSDWAQRSTALLSE